EDSPYQKPQAQGAVRLNSREDSPLQRQTQHAEDSPYQKPQAQGTVRLNSREDSPSKLIRFIIYIIELSLK
ncbi:hypothetical protein, partial [Okeania sp. SIO2B9]|uniref:hypothetical protein n=1 Tax=Okeania sp. SIO2B9 TaxID=2607782 RepID=UPI002579A9B2